MVCHARVALKACAEFAKSAELSNREVAAASEHAVVNRCQVACGDDEQVLTFAAAGPGGRVVVHFAEIKCCHHVGDAQRASRVAGFGCGDHPYDVSADLGCGSL